MWESPLIGRESCDAGRQPGPQPQGARGDGKQSFRECVAKQELGNEGNNERESRELRVDRVEVKKMESRM